MSVIVGIVVYYPRASAGCSLCVVAGSLLDVQHHTAISVLPLHGLLMKFCLIAVCNCGSRKDGEQNHSMGNPMDRTPPQSEDLMEIV